MTPRERRDVPTWERPEIAAAVDAAPPIPGEVLDVCRRVFSDPIDAMYEDARQARTRQPGSEAA